MNTRKYCPSCQSLNIKRISRNFFKKIIGVPLPYQCKKCDNAFTSIDIQRNELKEFDQFKIIYKARTKLKQNKINYC